MAEIVYVLCALTSVACAWLLYRQYRRRPTALILSSAVGFIGLGLNNVLLCVDLLVFPSVDFSGVRAAVSLISIGSIVFGLVWNSGVSRS